MVKCLITGGAGFIGHHLVDSLLENTDWRLTLLDRLDASGNLRRLVEMPSFERHRDRIAFVFHDLKAEMNDQVVAQVGNHDYILHLAAATHVDRSITDPLSFVMENVVGTCNLLNYVRKAGCDKMICFGTDEVFGPAPKGTAYREWDRYRSGNPYAASKAGAEELCLAYQNTYKVPVAITHCMNVFGERQHPEKFIPGTIMKVMRRQMVTIHADSKRQQPGSRFYIHARSVAEAVHFILTRNFVPGDKYNIVGEKEVNNLELARLIAKHVGHGLLYEMVDFHGSRPGHDLRYALDGSKMAELGWQPTQNFEERLEAVIRWALANPDWQMKDAA